jgi:CheY-like chemotaxis protein/nitrogen-specific signal transduction histidine kinase
LIPIPKKNKTQIEKAIQTSIETKQAFDLEAPYINPKGEKLWMKIIGKPSVKKNEKPHIIGLIQDISVFKETEENLISINQQLETSKQELIQAQKIAKIGNWTWFFKSNQLNLSEEIYSILESKYKNENQFLKNQKQNYPSDTWEDFLNAVEKAKKNKKDFELILEIPLQSKRNKYTIVRAKCILNDKKEVIGCKGTIQDITDQHLVKLELEKALQKAKESDQLKSAFLANMSHEIRTPMNGILGFTSLLKEDDLSKLAQEKYIDIIQKNAQRLLNTINDIIDISKIESGQERLNLEKTAIGEILNELLQFFEPEAKQKGLNIKLINTSSKDNSCIISDKDKLYSILSNLIKNAIKYTEIGSVTFGFHRSESSIRFFVQDTGVGIPKEKQKSIFERFVQAELEITRKYEGSGLGLSISSAYAKMLGGKISLISTPGKGSTFYLTLPCDEFYQQREKKTSAGINIKESDNLRKKTVLIAEDESDVYTYLNELLTGHCKQILHCDNGRDAIEICKSNKQIDIILMDVKMPEIDGLTATREIRKFNKTVKIIAQTAFAMESDRIKALDAGCDAYISKPILEKDLVSTFSGLYNS